MRKIYNLANNVSVVRKATNMKKQAAFTLIEVLIALFIIAIALAAAIQATNQSVRTTMRVRNTTLAHFVAMNILSEIQVGLMSSPTSDDPVKGKTKMVNEEWQWSAAVESENNVEQVVAVTVSLKNNRITEVEGYVEK